MLKSIFAAVMNALKSGLAALGRAATWPLRALAGGGGGMPMPAPDVVTEPGTDPVAERERSLAVGREMAAIIQKYAAESFLSDAPAQMPVGLSPELRAWARGLTREECVALIDADETDVSAHLDGIFLLAGVARVVPRPMAQWSRARTRDHHIDPELTVAAGYAL